MSRPSCVIGDFSFSLFCSTYFSLLLLRISFSRFRLKVAQGNNRKIFHVSPPVHTQIQNRTLFFVSSTASSPFDINGTTFVLFLPTLVGGGSGNLFIGAFF